MTIERSRHMAHRVGPPPRRRQWLLVGAAGIAIVAFALVGGSLLFAGGGAPSPTASTRATRDPSVAPSRAHPTPAPTASAKPSDVPAITATPAPTTLSTASASPAQTPPAGAAPTDPNGFDLAAQVVQIGFPLRSDTTYQYRDNWLDRRAGPPDPYNHARTSAGGKLVRLHDGIDIYAPEGEPVLAPFDGTIVDPATKWSPWHPDRYGLTVVVESDEPTSPGYYAVLVHLQKVWVEPGQHVSRAQVIGALGRTGDAQDVRPQLHFELRAPFDLDWSALGEDRMVDAFNPYPSLVAADPKR